MNVILDPEQTGQTLEANMARDGIAGQSRGRSICAKHDRAKECRANAAAETIRAKNRCNPGCERKRHRSGRAA